MRGACLLKSVLDSISLALGPSFSSKCLTVDYVFFFKISSPIFYFIVPVENLIVENSQLWASSQLVFSGPHFLYLWKA
jgi:hypothetical protein